MAASRLMSRASLSSLRSAVNSNIRSAQGSAAFPLPQKPVSSPLPRFSLSRTPSELGCTMSLLPLHSAVSTAKMTSCLSTSAYRALSQGTLCRTSPGL